ncbi:MAG: InlB B-repeat-containing protein [Lachnospiraceae bacterium]|nr:InlB B-repeat-containing protein [Lachnospiraceae bacterium]
MQKIKKDQMKNTVAWAERLILAFIAIAFLAMTGNAGKIPGLSADVSAKEYGDGDVIYATATGGPLVEAYSGEHPPMLTLTIKGDAPFSQDTYHSGYQYYDSSGDAWQELLSSSYFQMSSTYRYVVKLKPKAGDTITNGAKLIVDETGDYFFGADRGDEWKQLREDDPYLFVSPEFKGSYHFTPWSRIGDSATCESAFKDAQFKNNLKEQGVIENVNGNLLKSVALQVTELNLKNKLAGYTESFGSDDPLNGIVYFPNLRKLTVDFGDNTNVGDVNLSGNLYLWDVTIYNYKGTGRIYLPSSIRAVKFEDCNFDGIDDGTHSIDLQNKPQLFRLSAKKSSLSSEVNLKTDPKISEINLQESPNLMRLSTPQNADITYINVSKCSKLMRLKLEKAKQISYLDCQSCPALVEIDMSNVGVIGSIFSAENEKLANLYMNNARIDSVKELDFNGCKNLKYLYADKVTVGSYTELDFKNCNLGYPEELNMQGGSISMTLGEECTLDLDNNPNIYKFTPPKSNGTIKRISLSGCTNLNEIKPGSDKPTVSLLLLNKTNLGGASETGEVDLTDCVIGTKSWTLNCSYTPLKSVKYGQIPGSLNLSKTKMETYELVLPKDMTGVISVDCSECENLKGISVTGGKVSQLNAARCPQLTTFKASRTFIENLYLNECANLNKIAVSPRTTDITLLNCSKDTALTTLSLAQHNMRKLDCSGCTALESLDLSECPELTEVTCSRCGIASLNLKNLTKLNKLICAYCPNLKSVNLSDNAALEILTLGGQSDSDISSAIKELDVSACPQLKTLAVDQLKIEQLELHQNTKLTHLSCKKCELKTLDLSTNTLLTNLDCRENNLVALDLSKNSNLSYYATYLDGQTRSVTSLKRGVNFKLLDETIDVDKISDHGSGTAIASSTKYSDQGIIVFPSDVSEFTYQYDTAFSGSIQAFTVTMTIEGDRANPMVFFDACGGSVSPASAETNAQGQVSLPVPVRAGYDFNGWYGSKDYAADGLIPADKVYTNDTNIYAKWTEKKSVITFAAGGGVGSMDDVIITTGQPYTLPTCGFTAPEGKLFNGWDIGAIGTSITVTGSALTVTATWIDDPNYVPVVDPVEDPEDDPITDPVIDPVIDPVTPPPTPTPAGGNPATGGQSQGGTTGGDTGSGANETVKAGVGTFSADGKTLTDPNGAVFAVAETLTAADLKKGLAVADQKTGSKYRITKIVFKKGKFKSGTAEYVGPYDLNTRKISVAKTVKLSGNTFKVTAVAAKCTKGCKKVTKAVIGANVQTIAAKAFYNCKSLKTIQIKGKGLKKVGSKAFKKIAKKATIKVPKTKKSAYKKLLKKKYDKTTVIK